MSSKGGCDIEISPRRKRITLENEHGPFNLKKSCYSKSRQTRKNIIFQNICNFGARHCIVLNKFPRGVIINKLWWSPIDAQNMNFGLKCFGKIFPLTNWREHSEEAKLKLMVGVLYGHSGPRPDITNTTLKIRVYPVQTCRYFSSKICIWKLICTVF